MDEWDDKIANGIYEISKKLLDYEPATVELTPERIKDLFKRLYQNLVPRDVRHRLGEYFTPDWLAELLLEEVNYNGNPDKKVLDPACGSGTFLVLAIKKIREFAQEHFIDERKLLTKIVSNIKGIDLNPLAVLASKANYIIALADLLRYRPKEGIEIPVYLADSIAVGRRVKLTGEWEAYIKTVEGELWIPHEVIEKEELTILLYDIEYCIKNDYSVEDFGNYLKKMYKFRDETINSIARLYKKLLFLEKKGRNRIWTRILRNSFTPLLMGKFDFVIGNPPWINWENLPEFYREQTKGLWDWYGLTKRTKGTGLGKVKRDMAMLFVARCLDRYTKDGGKFAFLIPFTVYKTQAGAGFRSFLAKGKNENVKVPCKVLKIHDLVTLYPFEGAVNRTSLIILQKKERTKFPIPCLMWHNPTSKGIDQEAELEEVRKTTKQFELVFIPIEEDKPSSPWMEITEKAYKGIKKVIGSSPWYKAHEGVNTALNQVYWIEILSKQPNGLLITNPPLPGQKKKVKQVKEVVEKDLVYPLVRGRDVKKWHVKPDLGYILLPVDVTTGETLSHDKLKINYPKAWKYFSHFINYLVNRGGEPYKSKLEPYRKESFETAEKIAPPFYWLFNVKPSLAPYKVVWKYLGELGKGITISGKAVFSCAVIETINDEIVGHKTIIPNEKLMQISCKDKMEAYYLSSILNSSALQLVVASYVIRTQISTHVLNHLNIPKFDPSNSLHKRLSELSQKAHEITKKIYEEDREDLKDDLNKIENEIDEIVAKIYGITDEELKEIRKCLKILKEGEIEEEEKEEEELILPLKEIEVKVKPLLIYENEEKELNCNISNNMDKDMENVVFLEIDDMFFFKILLN